MKVGTLIDDVTHPSSSEFIVKKRSRNTAFSNVAKLAELGIATHHVMAHRLTRMANAGPTLSSRDKKEFTGMVLEKQLAFTQAWVGMCTELMLAQQRTAWGLLTGRPVSLSRLTNDIAAKGLAPVHRKAVSNSRRLARIKVR